MTHDYRPLISSRFNYPQEAPLHYEQWMNARLYREWYWQRFGYDHMHERSWVERVFAAWRELVR